MNKNLIIFVLCLIFLLFGVFLLLFQTAETKPDEIELIKEKPQTADITTQKKNDELIINKEDQTSNENKWNLPVVEKETAQNKIEKTEILKETVVSEESDTKKPEAKAIKPLYTFTLDFIGVAEKNLPEDAEVNLNLTNMNIKTSTLMKIKKDNENKFSLQLEDKTSHSFDIRIKNIGYGKNIKIPYDKETTIKIQLVKGSRISGIISDSAGKGIQNVLPSLLSEVDTGFGVSYFEPKATAPKSDESGKYEISDVEPGRYQVKLVHDKFITLEQWVSFPQNGDQEINFQMKEGSRIEGIVVDQNGKPVKDVVIDFQKGKKGGMFDMQDMRQQVVKEVKSDVNGQFIIEGLEVGPYQITVKVKGVGHIRNFKVEIQKGEMLKTIKLVLKPSLTIKGKVVDQKGNLMEGVTLKYFSDKMDLFGQRGDQSSSTSDKNGEFIFDFLDEKSYTIAIESETYRLASSTELVSKAGTDDLIVTIKKLLELNGVVLLPDGQKAKDYQLFLRYEQYSQKTPIKDVNITEIGFSVSPEIFEFGGITTKIQLVAKLKGYAEGISKEIEIKNEIDSINDIVIQLKDEDFVFFKVSCIDNQEIQEIEYLATPVSKRLNSPEVLEKAIVDENNQIQISALKDVEFDLFFKLKGYANILMKYKQEENPSIQEIVFTKGSTIKGLVYEKNGKLSAFQKMNLKRSDILSITLMQHLNYNTKSNENGEFIFENIPKGEYRLKKVDPNKAFSPMDIFNITEGEAIKITQDQEININIGAKEEVLLDISGQIYLDNKIFDKTASIFLSSKLSEPLSKMNTSNDEGKFSILQVKPGNYSLMIGLNGLGTEEMERFPITVKENQENFFPIQIYSDKISGVIIAPDDKKLDGIVSVFEPGYLSSQLNVISAFTHSLYSNSFKAGSFSIKFPQLESVDIYFSFNNSKYGPVYFQRITKEELQKNNWIINLAQNISREIKITDESGKKIEKFNFLICDDKGIALISDMKGGDMGAVSNIEEILLPPDKDCVLYVSSPGYSVTKKVLLKNDISPISITLATGFELTINAKNHELKIVELFDKDKKMYIYPSSKDEMVMSSLGGKKDNVIKDGKKIFKNLTPGKFYIKISDEKSRENKWSELIEIVDKNIEVEIK